MERYQIHRSTSFDWKPSAVVALTTSPDGSQVAAVREDGSLEIWLVSPGSVGWHCQLTIQGDNSSRVTSLLWCHHNKKERDFGRLLSSSVDGSVSEWDLLSLKQKIILESVGFSIWQMALEPTIDAFVSKKNPSNILVNGYANGYRNGETNSGSESCQSDADDDNNDFGEINSAHNGIENHKVAIACDDGCIRLYMISDSDGLLYKRSFPRVSGRTLSVAWSLDAKHLFSGSSDGIIRCWSSASASETYRITVGSGGIGSGSELCIWSLLFLRCGTIVSADSTGSVQFWDSCHGTLLQAHSYHKGDANVLAADPSHKRVFSSGSDGQVILYKMSNNTEDSARDDPYFGTTISKWAYVGHVRAHTHDVRCLVMAVPISSEDALLPDEKHARRRSREKPVTYSYHKWAHSGVPMLLSGGDDSKIFAYSATDFTSFSPYDICPAPQRVPFYFASKSVLDGCSVVLAQSPNCLDVLSVRCGGSSTFDMYKGGQATVTLLAKIKSKGSRKIISSTISSSGILFAYSDCVKPCLFELRKDRAIKNGLAVCKRKLPQELPCAHSMIFSADSTNIIFGGQDQKIYVVNVESAKLVHIFVPCRHVNTAITSPTEPPITKMFASSDGQWLAAINCFGDIYIFNLEIYRQHWFISRLDGASVTAGGFPPGNCSVLMITTSSNQVYVLDVEAKELGEWSRYHTFVLPRRFQEFPGEVIGLSFPPSSSTSVIVYSSRALCFIDFRMPMDQDDIDLPNFSSMSTEKLQDTSRNTLVKKKRKNIEPDPLRSKIKNFDFCAFKDPILFVGHLSGRSLLVLQKSWLEVLQTFDAPVHRHIYGT